MKLKSLYSNLSIKYKILISFWAVTIIITAGLGYFYFSQVRQDISYRISSSNVEIVSQINSSMNYFQKDLTDTIQFVSTDPGVQSALRNGYELQDNDKIPLNPSDILNRSPLEYITNLMASKNQISSVLLYTNNENFPPYFLSSELNLIANSFTDIQKSEQYNRALEAKGKPVWFFLNETDHPFVQNNNKSEIAIGKIIKDLITNDIIGFCVISVDEQHFQDIYVSNLQSDQENIAIVDESGVLISGSGAQGDALGSSNHLQSSDEKNSSGYYSDEIADQNMLIAYNKDNSSNWTIYYSIPRDSLSNEIASFEIYTLIIIFACIVLSFIMILLMSSILTKPIKTLLASMKKFQQGNFDERVSVRFNDEMGELGKGYNKMVSKIKNLIESEYLLGIKIREAELNALQAQINPHFLYNTLDTILTKAESSGDEEIAEMIYSLSRLFRLSLNRGKIFTSVSNEKELIENYLRLQKIRYKNRLKYEINIDDDILNHIIPKLILQPFVENSIVHGIESKKSGGYIKVNGYKESNCLIFSVEDNGTGIKQEKLDQLLRSVENINPRTLAKSDVGYAIENVIERLRLAYKDKYDIELSGKQGHGFKVVITIFDIDDFSFAEDIKE